MSQIESKTKFSMSNPNVNKRFTQDQFFKWSNDNHYRTSSHDMSFKVRIIKFKHFTSDSC